MALLAFWFAYVFLVGLAIGSFVNVCVARLPYEKSLIWPGSHCPKCFQPIRARDNIPLLGFVLLRGRCRTCGAPISWKYPLVELFTGLAFAGLFYAEMVANVLDLPILKRDWGWLPGMVPLEALPVYFHHAILITFLIIAALCDLADMEIPLSLTVTGTLVGLVLSMVFAWPYPESAPVMVRRPLLGPHPPPGVYAWPVWYPLPDWLPQGSWQLGLATGLAGAVAGMVMLRGVRFLFGLGRGIEGLGVGDADLMMMAGAFIGWQPVVLAFFVSVFPALIFAIGQVIFRGSQTLPFGPSLAAGVVITVLCWPRLGATFADLFFTPTILAIVGVGGGVSLLVVAFLLRIIRGGGTDEGDDGGDATGPYGPPQDVTGTTPDGEKNG